MGGTIRKSVKNATFYMYYVFIYVQKCGLGGGLYGRWRGESPCAHV